MGASWNHPMNSSSEVIYSFGLPDFADTTSPAYLTILLIHRLIIGAGGIPLHISIIYIIAFSSKRVEYGNVFYRLVIVLSCCDIFYAHFLLYQASCRILQECPFGEKFNLIFSTSIMYVDYLCMNTDMLIAVNRFTAIVFCNYYEWVFSPKNGWLIVLFGVALSLLKTIPAIIYGVKYVSECF